MPRRGATEITLLILGLILGCCWLPRGILGLLALARVVSPRLSVPDIIFQGLHLWADPLSWYGPHVFLRLQSVSPRALTLVGSAQNCLCGIVAVAITGVVIFMFVRASGTDHGEASQQKRDSSAS